MASSLSIGLGPPNEINHDAELPFLAALGCDIPAAPRYGARWSGS